MTARSEGTLAIVAALVVLFSAMWDPRISATISVAVLVGWGIYKFVRRQA
jgi:hypothetical protein